MTRTPVVTQDLIRRASDRTRHRVEVVAEPVEIIARRSAEGQSNRQISQYLQSHLGRGNPVASLDFVAWVIGEIHKHRWKRNETPWAATVPGLIERANPGAEAPKGLGRRGNAPRHLRGDKIGGAR